MAKTLNNRKLIQVFIFFLILLGLIIRVYKLKDQPFYDWDEGIYAQVAKEIIQNKSLKTTFNGEIWLNKPPLSHLLIAFSFKLFGFRELFARLIFTIFGISLLILLYGLTKKFFRKNNLIINLTPVLILASTPIFIERSSTLNTDVIIATSWVGYFLFFEKKLIKLLFLLLGVYSKSLVAFYPLLIEPFLWLKGKTTDKRKALISNLLFLITAIVTSSLWYIFAYLNYGSYFIKAHFIDQIFKRVASPIELHVGNKWYYFKLLWENLGFISFFVLIGLIIILFDLTKEFLKKRLSILQDENLIKWIILIYPLPFFGLLVLGKSKIYWYILFILPFITLYPSYLLNKFKNKKLRVLLFTPILTLTLLNFSKETFLYKPKIEINEKIKIAKCLSNHPNITTVAMLVDKNERKIRNVLEAAQLQTETSFIYGGSPSFVFYLNKQLKYFYKTEEFKKNYKNFDAIIIHKDDADIVNFINLNNYEEKCSVKNELTLQEWKVMVKIKK